MNAAEWGGFNQVMAMMEREGAFAPASALAAPDERSILPALTHMLDAAEQFTANHAARCPYCATKPRHGCGGADLLGKIARDLRARIASAEAREAYRAAREDS